MPDNSPYLMSPMEIALGYLFGHAGALPDPSDETATPRQALERTVRDALLSPPCGVAFSGGRDSSLVLAVATHVARSEGLPDPIPVSRVFPDASGTEEGTWQEMVVRHLGLSEWQRHILSYELDVIGPIATSRLVEHGVMWPPTIGADHPMMKTLRGGSLIDGEGGDEVLGNAAHRISPVSNLIHKPRPMRWGRVRSAVRAFAPARARTARMRHRPPAYLGSWLRPIARDAFVESLVEAESTLPFSFAASVRMVPLRRTQVLAARNRRFLAQQYHVDVSSPLLHPEVVHALARDGGTFSRGTRTEVLREFASDLLPDAVLSRTSKAEFNGAYMTRRTVEFAKRWTGIGVDLELVDPDELQRAWISGQPAGLTTALLQSAWLASNRPTSLVTRGNPPASAR